MEGVTTAIVGFIFVCIVYPKLVKNKPQFYAAFAMILAVILLHTLGMMIGSFKVVAAVFTGFLQIFSLILLVLSAGGITLRELGTGMADAYEVIRRGESEKEIIVPLRGEIPQPRREPDRESVPLEEPDVSP